MPLIHDHAQQPYGGHNFTDPTGVVVRAASIKDLLRKIAAFRESNGLPSGDPATEVEAYYATQYPWLVTPVGSTPAAIEDPVEAWLNRMWREAPRDFVNADVVATRLGTCTMCQHYASAYPLSPESSRRLAILSQGRPPCLGACGAHGWALGLALLLRGLRRRVNAAGCWAES